MVATARGTVGPGSDEAAADEGCCSRGRDSIIISFFDTIFDLIALRQGSGGKEKVVGAKRVSRDMNPFIRK